MGDEPKSAFELAMERLRAADRDAGVEEKALSDAQKTAIGEARRVASSQLAEREILYQDALKKTLEPEERRKAEEEYRIDRERIERDRDRKIEAIRKRTS